MTTTLGAAPARTTPEPSAPDRPARVGPVPTGTAAARRFQPSRLLAGAGAAAGAVSLAFGAPVSPRTVATLLHGDHRRNR